MPSQFDIALAESLEELFQAAGRPATWDGQEITVLPASQADTSTGAPGHTNVPTETIQVRESDIGGPPRTGTVVVYMGSTWRSQPFPRATGGCWTVSLQPQMQHQI